MSRVQEGLEPWVFENGDGKTYGSRRETPRTAETEKKSEAEKCRITPEIYWKKCLELKNAITDYISVKKLALNAIDPSRFHSVKHVIDRYYGGDKSNVFENEATVRKQLGLRIRAYNVMCIANDIDPSDPDTLIFQLSTIPYAGDKFKDHIMKHMDEGHPPFPLEMLANEFKYYHPAWYGKEG